MISPKDVHSLSDFQRNAKKMLTQLKRSKRPALLTVNGKGTVVVQDADAYTAMIAALEKKYLIEAVRVGIEQMDAGKGRPAAEVFKELDAELKAAGKRRRRSA